MLRQACFLPHASAADGNAARQPIWLTVGEENPNGAQVRFLADRAAPSAVATYARVVLLFAANDPDAVAAARRHWTPLKTAGHACTYWRQSPSGRWEQKG